MNEYYIGMVFAVFFHAFFCREEKTEHALKNKLTEHPSSTLIAHCNVIHNLIHEKFGKQYLWTLCSLNQNQNKKTTKNPEQASKQTKKLINCKEI